MTLGYRLLKCLSSISLRGYSFSPYWKHRGMRSEKKRASQSRYSRRLSGTSEVQGSSRSTDRNFNNVCRNACQIWRAVSCSTSGRRHTEHRHYTCETETASFCLEYLYAVDGWGFKGSYQRLTAKSEDLKEKKTGLQAVGEQRKGGRASYAPDEGVIKILRWWSEVTGKRNLKKMMMLVWHWKDYPNPQRAV